MTEFKPGDIVAINGPIDNCTGVGSIVRFERYCGADRAVCRLERSAPDEGSHLHSIPLRHLHPVSNTEYQVWNHARYVRRFQPPLQGPIRAPVPKPDRDVERAIQILAISEALTASWRARGIISDTPAQLEQLELLDGPEAA